MNDSLTFEEFRVGDKWISPARTVTEDEVMQFAGLTGDFDPLHVETDSEFESPFGQPIAHGLLGLSLVAGLGSDSPRAATTALVSVREWRFVGPIYFGDTVHAETEVQEKKSNGRRHGLIIWKRRLLNQHGEVLQEGIFETLVRVAASKPVDGPIASS